VRCRFTFHMPTTDVKIVVCCRLSLLKLVKYLQIKRKSGMRKSRGFGEKF